MSLLGNYIYTRIMVLQAIESCASLYNRFLFERDIILCV